jgi:uncharacterized membrane protein
MDYIWKAASAWFVGFFPLAEIYVAVPSAVALGLDDVSVIFWTVFGNFTPALLISVSYEQIIRIPRLAKWLGSLVSERVQVQINRWGMWFILLVTPWAGIWVIATTAKVLQMHTPRFLLSAFISIFVYAVVVLALIKMGITAIE